MKNWIFLAVSIFGEVIATSALKSSHGFTRLVPSVVVVAGYGLRSISCLSRSSPFRSVLLTLYGLGLASCLWQLLLGFSNGQKLDFWAFIGMGLIVSGRRRSKPAIQGQRTLTRVGI